ncbi:hypothetical protein K378_01480 [Streptomyces sp. Amel2xB2]|uniref:hypothetical protein n=1 Tax=Streptomyces sp. Amel2xB2 TaxID=1305829 RepID=UPI000DBAD0A0|nr:hypothetical protein [Streptomyces sp. Amel2xB2]RAJ70315.1 hypothetical protein K378_01480 [Streptomyces sp. Amel2xB2]
MSATSEIKPGQVWASRYQTGIHVAIQALGDGGRARLLPVTVTPQGAVTFVVGRQRWTSGAQLRRGYRLTEHVVDSLRD